MSGFLSKNQVELVREKAADTLTRMAVERRGIDENAFYVADLGDVVKKWQLWHKELPRVEPHYAVKCNNDRVVVSLLAALGAGFDCASKEELQQVLRMGVSPKRIVYANPCKQNSHIKFAAKKNVARMTFDNETELHKIKDLYPDAELIIRVLPPEDTKCQCPLGMKFGVHPKKTKHLLQVAKALNLNVIGVSFHVGSGCYDETAFSSGVASARMVFDIGADVGYKFSLLDIGGGFPGQDSAKISFQQICAHLRPSLDYYFPADEGVRVIAEPGRFFVASAFHLAVNIISRRVLARDQPTDAGEPGANDEPMYMYYVNDGVYGSFNCLLYDHAEVTPRVINPQRFVDEPVFECSIWGPTCDGLDCISKACMMPSLEQGDWMYFADMGAYTLTAASQFNGFPKPDVHYVFNDADWVTACGVSEELSEPVRAKKARTMSCGMEVGSIIPQQQHIAALTAQE